MLTINNLTKKFGEKLVLDKISLNINPGEIFSLVGPNGSGKTTIIKIVVGLLQPTAGEVKVNNFNVVNEPEKAKQEIGYIPDEPSIWSFMTGEEFLHLTGALYGLTQAERLVKLPELIDIFKLQEIKQEYFEEYSRGNKQKFCILAALLHQPKLLLIDEPIVGLDPGSAEIAKAEFVKFARNGGAVFLVTHTLSVAEEISTRIGILQQGKLAAVGTMNELRQKAGQGQIGTLEEVYKGLIK